MDELRAACAEVARRARFVRIDAAAIAPYAASLGIGAGAHTGGDAPAAAPDEASRAARAGFWLTLDAINFGSGWFPTLRKDPGASGYTTIAAAWRHHWETAGPLSPAALTALEPAELGAILGQDPAHRVGDCDPQASHRNLELMALYARSLGDLGARIEADASGSFLALVDGAGGSALALARQLGEWPCFADRSRYEELTVPFLKRAQIAAADLGRAGVASFTDAERLTMFADNLVPHVLRLDGVLAFAPELVARIDAGELIAHGSLEEIEIRAGAVHAVELIVAASVARGTPTSAAAVDELLWNRGRGQRYKAAPRHRTRCTAY